MRDYSFLLGLLLLIASSLILVAGVEVPAELLAKALNYAQNNMPEPEMTVQNLQAGDIDTLYKAAKSLNENEGVARFASIMIWHILADGDAQEHILSQVALSFTYMRRRIRHGLFTRTYFKLAGEDGPHHVALFNAGRLLVDTGDYAGALAYLRAGVNLSESQPRYAQSTLTVTSRDAYEALSLDLVSRNDLSLEQMANMFLYAHLSNFPAPGSPKEKLWEKAMVPIEAYSEAEDAKHLDKALQNLIKLEKYNNFLHLQSHLLQSLRTLLLKKLKNGEGEEL
eukprot:scaffold76485_cov55-Attheya_sp.AAC.4